MDAGIRLSWGRIVPGREREALVLFDEAVLYYGQKLGEKKITFFEPFLFETGDESLELGFFIMKGPVAEIFKLIEDETFKVLQTKAQYLVEHFKLDLLTVGEEIGAQMKRYEKVLATYGA